MNTDDFRTPATRIVPVPERARKYFYVDVNKQRNADHANQDRVDDPSHFAPTVLLTNKYNGSPKNKQPTYISDLLMRKRLILSDDVRKTTLVKHDERPNESNAKKDVEDDETFFENLKKRIKNDHQNNTLHKTPKPVPKSLPKARKCKSLLNNETRNMMNKFRQEFANNQSRKLLGQEHPDSEMPQRATECGMTKDIMLEHHKTDDDLLRGTPPFHDIHAKDCNHQPTPPPFEHQHPGMPQKVKERPMTRGMPIKYFETDEDSNCSRSPFNEIHAEAHKHQPTPMSSERNEMLSMKRRGNTCTGENICEHTHQVMPQKVKERRITRGMSMKYFETDEDWIRSRSPFNEIHSEAHKSQLTPTSSERNGMLSMECRGNSWTGDNIRERTDQVKPQKVEERRMTRGILKYYETDEDSIRSRSPFNEIHAEAHKRQPTPTSSERNGMLSMERRDNSWTGENICENTHHVMLQKVAERRMTRDIPIKYFETAEDSRCGRQSFNEFHVENCNCQPTPSPSQSNEAFSMEHQSSSSTRGNICEHPRLTMPQSVMEHNRLKDILWAYGETDEDSLQNTLTSDDIDGYAYNRQPIPLSSQRNGAFLMERRSNNLTRESICEHRHPATAQNGAFLMERRSNNLTRESICEHRHPAMAHNVVERGPTKDIMFKYLGTNKDSMHGAPYFNEIHPEAYDRQPTFSSLGSNTFVKYYTTYYQK